MVTYMYTASQEADAHNIVDNIPLVINNLNITKFIQDTEPVIKDSTEILYSYCICYYMYKCCYNFTKR